MSQPTSSMSSFRPLLLATTITTWFVPLSLALSTPPTGSPATEAATTLSVLGPRGNLDMPPPPLAIVPQSRVASWILFFVLFFALNAGLIAFVAYSKWFARIVKEPVKGWWVQKWKKGREEEENGEEGGDSDAGRAEGQTWV